MAKKGLDADRLKFFSGMGESDKTDHDKPESDKSESGKSESVLSESVITESDISGSGKTESEDHNSDKSESVLSESVISESDMSRSDRTDSEDVKLAISELDKSESSLSDAVKSESDISESDKTESRLSESDTGKHTNKRRKQAPKITLPKSRAPSAIPKIRAKKVDDSVLDMALSAALNSPKVSIYSPFVAAVIKCNELTTIGYKSSADSRELLEKALEQTYPDVCEKVRRYMENK